MPSYKVTLTDEERNGLQKLIQKGGKGYRIKHAQILLKLDQTAENTHRMDIRAYTVGVQGYTGHNSGRGKAVCI